jgi:four helix bundle protein
MSEEGRKHRTSNAEHRTSNAEAGSRRVFDLEERLLEYSVQIIRLIDSLHATRAGNHVSSQLVRSSTSPLSNHGEAESAESPADFVHKLRICLKELRESRQWLRLIYEVPLLDSPDKVQPLISESEELIRIFMASIRTAEARLHSARVREEAPAGSDTSAFDVQRSMFDVSPSSTSQSQESRAL